MSSWGAGVPDREAEMGRRRGLLLRCVRNSQEAEVSLIEGWRTRGESRGGWRWTGPVELGGTK